MTVPAAISASRATCARLTRYRLEELWTEVWKQVNKDAESNGPIGVQEGLGKMDGVVGRWPYRVRNFLPNVVWLDCRAPKILKSKLPESTQTLSIPLLHCQNGKVKAATYRHFSFCLSTICRLPGCISSFRWLYYHLCPSTRRPIKYFSFTLTVIFAKFAQLSVLSHSRSFAPCVARHKDMLYLTMLFLMEIKRK